MFKRWITLSIIYPLDSTIGFPNTYHWTVIYPVDSAIRLLNNKDQMCVRITVKAGQAYPPRPLMNYYSQFESVGSCTYQIHLCILACVPPQFPWIWCKCLRKFNPFKDFQSDQIQRSSRKRFTAHYACSNAHLNLTLVMETTDGFIF